MKTEINPHSERYEAMMADTTNIQYEWFFYKSPSSKNAYLENFVCQVDQLLAVGPIHRSRFMDDNETLLNNFLDIPLMYPAQRYNAEDDTHGIFLCSATPKTIAMMNVVFNEIGHGGATDGLVAICVMRALNSKDVLSTIGVKRFKINNVLGLYSYGSAERFIMAIDGAIVSDRAAIGLGCSLVNVRYNPKIYSMVDDHSADFALGNYTDAEYKDLIFDIVTKGSQ